MQLDETFYQRVPLPWCQTNELYRISEIPNTKAVVSFQSIEIESIVNSSPSRAEVEISFFIEVQNRTQISGQILYHYGGRFAGTRPYKRHVAFRCLLCQSLFYTEITHSFISIDFVDQLAVEIHTIPFRLKVMSPVKAILIDVQFVMLDDIYIEGNSYPIQLINFNMVKFDVILGMKH